MTGRQLLWACSRRWRIIVLVVAFGMVLGLVTAPSSSDLLRKQHASLKYTATNTLEATITSRSALPRLILEATTGTIPAQVAKAVGDTPGGSIVGVTGPKATSSTKSVGGASLAGRVSIGGTDVTIDADPSSGAVHVKATDQHAKRAEAVATAFGDALVVNQHDKAAQAYQQEWVTLDTQRQALQKEVANLGAQSRGTTLDRQGRPGAAAGAAGSRHATLSGRAPTR